MFASLYARAIRGRDYRLQEFGEPRPVDVILCGPLSHPRHQRDLSRRSLDVGGSAVKPFEFRVRQPVPRGDPRCRQATPKSLEGRLMDVIDFDEPDAGSAILTG